ncbi:hypothetical protein [Brevibacillus fulvus]|uniref:Uncharacterized protein n=1 Tax=Brevibacillus fulvus TaxID=1125967 RepID=A0A939BRX5_9BACL|nr:hypothetical protein [Brevibacillus fulvus]MBM7590102.1 hypothetical protein [Brevibacillus fulvus]
MRQIFKLQTLYWALFAIALFLIYHLLVKIAVLDASWIALLLLIPVMILGYFLVKPAKRRQVTVFALAFLLLDRALTGLDVKSLLLTLLGGALAIVVISLIAKWYGRLPWNAVLVLALLPILSNATFNRDNLYVLNHFYIQWESDRLYSGEWVDYFPITLYDVNHDGKQEIITYGNAEEVPQPVDEDKKPETEAERKALAEKLLPIQSEPVSLYVYTYQNGHMQRMPNDQFTADQLAEIKAQIPEDFPGFPYYTQTDTELRANVQRQSYAEGMLQVGTAPYRAFLLDMQNLQEMLAATKGKMDSQDTFNKPSKYRDVRIKNGVVQGTYDGKPFTATTKATKILDTMHLPDGQEGLLVMGENISVLEVEPAGSVKEAYTLTRQQIPLSTANLIIADIDHDQTDEILVGSTPSYILKPTADGNWQILWASAKGDESFRFTNYAPVGTDTAPEIVAQAKSWVSAYPLRYVSGFDFTPEGLKQNWKLYLSLINIQVGDIDGDGQNELVASIYDSHKLLILKQHDIPVMPITIAIFVILIGYGVVRRFRHA